MDFVCATLFHSNVNKVSPNRNILAGEKVGIAWLLPKEPGVYWYGVFPSFLWLRSLQVWACLHCSSCYTKSSFVKSTLLWRPSSQCSDSWSWCSAPTDHPREVSEVLAPVLQTHLCVLDDMVRALALKSEQMCCCPLEPGLSRVMYRQHQQHKVKCFQLLLFSLWFAVNFNVT